MRSLLFTLALVAAATACAQTSQQPFFNVITLETSATADVPTDTLTVTLFTEEQGPDPGALATRVNARTPIRPRRRHSSPRFAAPSC